MSHNPCHKVAQGTATPQEVERCRMLKEMQDMMKELLKLRFWRTPIRLPKPDPGPLIPDLSAMLGRFAGEPNPQPSIVQAWHVERYAFGEMFMDALKREPLPGPSLWNDLRESGVAVKAIEDTIEELESAASTLRAELEVLQDKGFRKVPDLK